MIGKQLGRWLIERELGRGGMGTVYFARRDPAAPNGHFASDAAVKVLAPELATEPGFVHRFQREIDALSRLSHPHIVRLYEAGSENGQSYYAMEYVAGRTFEELLVQHGRLPWQEVLEAAIQICPALKHAHDHGVIHRDLKPQNLMRTDDGTVKLTDFGIAKIFATKQLTATGGLVGTADYLSPEQAAGKPVTARSDLYSLGIVLYTLLTGRPPFRGKGMTDILHKHLYGQFDRPQRVVPDIPLELDDVVCRLLEKDPAHRPANGYILLRELQSIQRARERRGQRTVADLGPKPTRHEDEAGDGPADDQPGPGTLTARFVREEAKREAEGGVVGRWLNRPLVLVALFLGCLSIFAWKLWPRATPSAQSLFEQGSRLMASENPADWQRAWDEYLLPLEQRYPNNPYRREVDAYRQRKQDYEQLMRAVAHASQAGPVSDAQRFFQRGLALCQQGDARAAQAVWRDLVRAFSDVESEQHWVRLAEVGLDRLGDVTASNSQSQEALRAAIRHANALREAGKSADAEKVWQALEHLYRRDGNAGAALEEIRRERAQAKTRRTGDR